MSEVKPQKTALICGVSGQDGAYLAQLLLAKGYLVYGTSRDAQINRFDNLNTLGVRDQVQTLSMAVSDFRSVVQVLDRVKPDEIYNLCGQSSVGLSFQQPVETLDSIGVGTVNILEAMRFLGQPVRFYNAGSSECFGEVETAADETTAFRPRSPYAVAKSTAHWFAANYREAYDLHVCSGILFNHESPLRPERFVTQKIIAAAKRIAGGSDEVLTLGNLEIARDWGWAPEYVEAMWLMLQPDTPRDYVIATGHTFTLREFCQGSFDALGLDWQAHVQIDAQLYRPSDITRSAANPTLALAQLGWQASIDMYGVIQRMLGGSDA